MTVNLGPELWRFETFRQWTEMSAGRFRDSVLGIHQAVSIDAKGRICTCGRSFMRAHLDDAYPVVVYLADPDDPWLQQKELAEKLARLKGGAV